MHIEKVRFDEVFDVAAHRGDFSFRSRGHTQYGVNLKNDVIPREGSTFAIAFAEPGDWTTVLGWRDLESADVMLTRPTWSLWLFNLSDIILYGLILIVGGLLLAGVGGGIAVTVVIAAVAFYGIVRGMRLNHSVKEALLGTGMVSGQSWT